MSDKLTFGDLKPGDKFIGFPLPGDDAGHGGYKQSHYIYTKVECEGYPFNDPEYYAKNSEPGKAVPLTYFQGIRNIDKSGSIFPDTMHVLKIE